jgi:EspG family
VSTDELTLGSEELETLLHALGDAAALPGRLAPNWQLENGSEDCATAVRRTAAHSLLARGLVRQQPSNGGFEVRPDVAALLAVPTRPSVGFEFDLERDGELSSGAGCATTDHGVLVVPRRDGTVLVRQIEPGELAEAVVDVAGSAPPGDGNLDLPRTVLTEPLASTDPEALVARGLTTQQAAALARILRDRTGSGRAFAIRTHDTQWVSSPLPVAWWDTANGRYLVSPGPVGPDGQTRLINVRGCTNLDLRNALAELTTTLV